MNMATTDSAMLEKEVSQAPPRTAAVASERAEPPDANPTMIEKEICRTPPPSATEASEDDEPPDTNSNTEKASDLPTGEIGEQKEEKEKEKHDESSSSISSTPPNPPVPPPPTNAANNVANEEIQYPKAGVVAVIMIALYLAVLLIALDRTIIATAIPHITDDFHSLGDVGWYGSAYLLTSSAFQLVFGRIYTFCSPKWVFLSSIFIFEVGSAVCGSAPNSVVFIIGRAIAGLGSAGIFSGSIIFIVYIIPLNRRPIYTGSLGAVFAVASVAGPLLGGAFTQDITWRWCFYVNLPIGAVTFIIVFFILNLPTKSHFGSGMTIRQILLRLDPLGNLFLLPSIVCLLLALQWGGTTYTWSDARIIALLVLFGVLLIAFIAVQVWKKETGTIPLHIIKQRSIACATIFIFFVGASMITMIYYLPIWFQAILGVSAVGSGIRNIPLLLATFITSMGSGFIITKVGYYTPFMIACSIIISIGAGLLTTFTSVGTGHSKWIGYQALFGIGLGLGSQQASLSAQVVLPRKDVPTGASLVYFSQSLGGSIAVSIGSNIFNNRLISGLEAAKIPNLDPSAVANAGATELRSVVSQQDLPMVLEIYNTAVMGAFKVALAFACISIIGAVGMEFRSVKKAKKSIEKPSNDVQAQPSPEDVPPDSNGRPIDQDARSMA